MDIAKKFTPLILFTLVCSVIFFSLHGHRGLFQLLNIHKEVELLENENRILRSEIFALEENITQVDTEPYLLEKKSREELGLSKAEDIVYIFSKGAVSKRSLGREGVKK